IAIDRALHFVVLAALGLAVLLFAHREDLRQKIFRVLADVQETIGGGPVQASSHGFLHSITKVFTLQSNRLSLLALAILAYALLEGIEAVGLWYQKRWAEYLTFFATALFLPLEIYELSHKLSPFKVFALILNVAVVIYLLLAKRLFGLRGGARAAESDKEDDVGWSSLERSAPERVQSSR
ncbi:MAG: DUF2127 domain-containing protein, partial [Solirubrobacteraceae bacterium]